ncbi:11997_t:CDS:1, partial [Racocetra persica]
MASSSQTVDNPGIHMKRCSRYYKSKIIEGFIRLSKNSLEEYSICNTRAEKRKGKSVTVKSEEAASSENLNLAYLDEIITEENSTFYELADLEGIIANCFMNANE